MILEGGISKNYTQNWDKNGNIYYTDENGQVVDFKVNPFVKLANKVKATATNIGDWINETDPNSEAYKQKVSAIVGLETLPLGLGRFATQGIAKGLAPYVGRKIAQNIATGESGGVSGGTVTGGLEAGLNDRNIGLGALNGGFWGLLGGLGGGYGLGKVAQKFTRAKLPNNPQIQEQYFNDYVADLNNKTKAMADFRAGKLGMKNGKMQLAYDLIADENGNPINVFHGTGTYFDNFDKNMLGSLTGANSAKKGFWFSEGENTAKSYAKYAAENSELNKLIKKQQAMERMPLVNWDEYDKLTEQIEQMALNGEPSTPRLIRANLDMNNPAYYDAKGQKFMEIQQEINDFLENNPQADGFVIRNLRDVVDNSYDEATNHYMIRNPEQIKILENRLLEDL